MQNNLILHLSDLEKEQQRLQKVIEKRKKALFTVTEKYEELEMRITAVQQEYNRRVGTHYIRDNALDLQIIQYKKINSLMDKGLSYEEALKEVKKQFRKSDESDESFFFDMSAFEETEGEEKEDIKKLWKKLVHLFHPDLAQSPDDRKNREEIMKQINIAYRKHDYATLAQIHEKQSIEHIEDYSVEQLHNVYSTIENAIIRIAANYQSLKKSQWYSWLKKSKEEKDKLFDKMELEILQDIVVKDRFLYNLKQKYNLQ